MRAGLSGKSRVQAWVNPSQKGFEIEQQPMFKKKEEVVPAR